MNDTQATYPATAYLQPDGSKVIYQAKHVWTVDACGHVIPTPPLPHAHYSGISG